MTKDLLPMILPAIKKGLQDDDVRAVAAATLVPVSQELVSLMPKEVILTVYGFFTVMLIIVLKFRFFREDDRVKLSLISLN